MATSGKSWRQAREEGFEITFPSGNVAAIRPIEVDFFVMHGKVPDALAETVNAMIQGQAVKFELSVMEQMARNREEWLPFLNTLVRFAFVRPQVVEHAAGDEEIEVDDVSYRDKVFLYQFFSLPAHVLRRFCEGQGKPVERLEPVTGNGASAE